MKKGDGLFEVFAAVGLLLFVFVAAVTTCQRLKKPEVVRASAVDEQVQRAEHLRYTVGRIEYIKDARTNVCFAYLWGGGESGGPALATVSCEAIPPEMLTLP
ncbi:hypothetical protein EPN90_00825 [Patescibacteria group bacterium]|nr:MAG: hypothetical protein EPN90_00825 [Patescibacteria group bacterium]